MEYQIMKKILVIATLLFYLLTGTACLASNTMTPKDESHAVSENDLMSLVLINRPNKEFRISGKGNIYIKIDGEWVLK